MHGQVPDSCQPTVPTSSARSRRPLRYMPSAPSDLSLSPFLPIWLITCWDGPWLDLVPVYYGSYSLALETEVGGLFYPLTNFFSSFFLQRLSVSQAILCKGGTATRLLESAFLALTSMHKTAMSSVCRPPRQHHRRYTVLLHTEGIKTVSIMIALEKNK